MSKVEFTVLMFCFVHTCFVLVLVLSINYLPCIGLFCMYVLANSRQWFFCLAMYSVQL